MLGQVHDPCPTSVNKVFNSNIYRCGHGIMCLVPTRAPVTKKERPQECYRPKSHSFLGYFFLVRAHDTCTSRKNIQTWHAITRVSSFLRTRYMFNHAVPRTCTSRKILLVLHVLIQQYLWLRDMLPRVSPTWGTGTLGIMSLSHMFVVPVHGVWKLSPR